MYTAKLTREKPKLHLDGLLGGRIKVRAGEPINISIPISGAPTPRIDWTINGQKPPETNRILVSIFPRYYSVTITIIIIFISFNINILFERKHFLYSL